MDNNIDYPVYISIYIIQYINTPINTYWTLGINASYWKRWTLNICTWSSIPSILSRICIEYLLYCTYYHYALYLYVVQSFSDGRTKLLTTRNGHGESGWSSIGCDSLYFHAMCKHRVSVSGWSPIGCEGFHTNLKIASPLPTTLVFY